MFLSLVLVALRCVFLLMCCVILVFLCLMFLGLANKKTVTIQPAGKDQSVLLATTKAKKQCKPAALHNKSVMKKEFRRMAKAVTNQVRYG